MYLEKEERTIEFVEATLARTIYMKNQAMLAVRYVHDSAKPSILGSIETHIAHIELLEKELAKLKKLRREKHHEE